jgi:hypothetical protein
VIRLSQWFITLFLWLYCITSLIILGTTEGWPLLDEEEHVWQPEPLSRNESGGFGALKSDSTHHFFRNACTNYQVRVITVFRFPVVDWFCLFIYLWVLTFPLQDCSEFGNFVITLMYYSIYKYGYWFGYWQY